MKTANTFKNTVASGLSQYATQPVVSSPQLHVVRRLKRLFVKEEKVIDRKIILAAAQRSPSGDNCQPWTFRWDTNKLFIYHNEDKAKHYLNVNNYASLLTLGCVVESISLAAVEQDFSIQCKYAEVFDGNNQESWATIQFVQNIKSSSSLLDKDLYKHIDDRYTYRGKYIKHDLQSDILSNKSELTGNLSSTNFFVTDTQPKALTDYLLASDSFVWSKLKGIEDLLKWIRFANDGHKKFNDGILWKDLGINAMDKIMLRILSWKAASVKFLNLFGFRSILKAKLGNNIRSSSGFVCITVDNNNSLSIINAGRLSMKCWLYLTKEGFAVQPQTSSALNAFIAQQNLLPSDCNAGDKRHFIAGKSILQEHFNTSAQPIWLFRYGMAGKERKEKTIRNSISELLISENS